MTVQLEQLPLPPWLSYTCAAVVFYVMVLLPGFRRTLAAVRDWRNFRDGE